MPSRRAALLMAGSGVAATAFGLPRLAAYFEPALSFKALPGNDGFRQLSGGSVSKGNPALVGIDQPDLKPAETYVCAHLFTGPRPSGHVPVAYFSDARCVYCRVLSPLLNDLETREPIAITWHELPLLGPASRRAAQAALAARRQGAYAIFHDRLMGTPFMPNTAYIRKIALDAGVDVEQLLRDMQGADVADTIARTAGLARRFGFYGTPALVVGRTAVLGSIDERKLRRLIEIEANMTDPGPCS